LDPKVLFPDTPALYFKTKSTVCTCSEKLKVLKTRTKTVSTLAIGKCNAHETLCVCSTCGILYYSDLVKQIPPHCRYGYDVIDYVGKAMFTRYKSEEEIKIELEERNISASLREISYLGKKFIIYLALVHKESQEKLKEHMQSNGGYILHLDGTCEGDSPHLISSIDEVTNIVLDNIKAPSENTLYTIPYLKRIKAAYGDPLAVVHDMSSALIRAATCVFPDAKDYICHYHFLRDIGKDMFGGAYQSLTKYLTKFKVRPELRKIARDSKKIIDGEPALADSLNDYLHSETIDHFFITVI